MKKKMEEHSIDGVFVLLVFGIYGMLLLALLLLGANNYKNLVEKNDHAYNKRIGVSYIAAKIRHNDTAGEIKIGGFTDKEDNISTLHLYQKLEEEIYETRIYYYKGYIREMLTLPDLEVEPEDGNIVMKAKALKFTESEGTLIIYCTDEGGEETSLRLCLRSEGKERRQSL
ncbi:MAG: DUF4860 domain-containing protein [Acetivibrio sp.]